MDTNEIKEVIREEIRSTMKDLMKQLKEDILKEVDEKCERKLDIIREEIQEVRRERDRTNKEVDMKLNVLNNRMNNMEEYSRHENVIIRGIKYQEEEKFEELVAKVTEVAKKLRVDLNKSEISTAHRLPSKSRNTPPPVIVRVTNRWKKEELIAASKQYRIKDVYITHQLTPFKYGLLKEALELKRKEAVKYVWTTGNRIMVRRSESEEAVQIMNIRSLMKFGWKDDVEIGSEKTQEDSGTEEEGNDTEEEKSEDEQTEGTGGRKTAKQRATQMQRQKQDTIFNKMMSASGSITEKKKEAKTMKTRNTSKRAN